MKTFITTLLVLITSTTIFAQTTIQIDRPSKKLTPDHLVILNDEKKILADVSTLNPNDVATVDAYDETTAVKLFGDAGKGGVLKIQTKAYVQHKYTSFFRKQSKAYDKLYNQKGSDSAFIYILNDEILKNNIHSKLSTISENNFLNLKIIDNETLLKKYNFKDKSIGILIFTKQ